MTMRLIQRQLQNPLAKMLLAGTIKDGDTVEVSVRDGQLTLNGNKIRLSGMTKSIGICWSRGAS